MQRFVCRLVGSFRRPVHLDDGGHPYDLDVSRSDISPAVGQVQDGSRVRTLPAWSVRRGTLDPALACANPCFAGSRWCELGRGTGRQSSPVRKNITRPVKPADNIEYKVAQWLNVNLPDSRVWLPGSIGQWLNAWSDEQQMTGGSWSTAYNAVHQKIAAQSIYVTDSKDADLVQTWLKAYGVRAFAVPGKQSPEFWKPFNRPEVFDGCDILWQQEDTKICRVPGASTSFAHVHEQGRSGQTRAAETGTTQAKSVVLQPGWIPPRMGNGNGEGRTTRQYTPSFPPGRS